MQVGTGTVYSDRCEADFAMSSATGFINIYPDLPMVYSKSMITVISVSMTPHPEGRGLYFHFATASRIFLSMSLRPERRVMVTLRSGSFSQCRLKNHIG
jgi:hypothetical protein